MKNLSKSEFELLVENQKGNYSLDSTRKELASSNLHEVAKITSEDLGIQINEIVVGKIFSLENCFLVIIDTYEEDYSFYVETIDEAQKIASDKVYEYSNL